MATETKTNCTVKTIRYGPPQTVAVQPPGDPPPPPLILDPVGDAHLRAACQSATTHR